MGDPAAGRPNAGCQPREDAGVQSVMQAGVMPSRDDDLSQDDGALCRRAQGGDREAFGEIVRRHQRLVWMVCRQYVGVDDADEAAQDTFLKAYLKLGTYDGRAKLSTWLVRIAINTCLDLLRKRGRRAPVVDDADDDPAVAWVPDDGADPERRAIQKQAVARLAELERSLPERQREIFRLRFYAEMDVGEIAEALGVHVGTVKTQLFRAVHRLRRELEAVR